MSRTVDVNNSKEETGTGIVEMGDRDTKKVPTRGQHHWTLTSIETGAGTATVKLKGTNNPDPADLNGEDLITNTHTGSDQKDGSASSKGYKYVFVDITAASAPTFAVDSIKLHGTGFSGLE